MEKKKKGKVYKNANEFSHIPTSALYNFSSFLFYSMRTE